ncbi:MAG: polysaccharide pyruvyl transferase family protein, partial [Acidimicrobiia bacterium]
GDVVLFLDSDAIVKPDFVSRHASWHMANEDVVVIGGRTQLRGADLDTEALARGSVDLDEATSPDEGEDFRSVLSRRTSGFEMTDEGYRAFVSSNVSLSSRLFVASGGFDPRFRRWSGEDTELGWRLWQAGARFIDDNANRIFHQIDADTAGGMEGRQHARELNMGLLSSLIPQRFYRKGMPEPPPEVPKFSILVHDLSSGAPRAVWRAMLAQTLPDFELIFIAEPQDHDPFAGAAEGERRIHFAPDAQRAVSMSRGEYLVFFDGHGAPSRTMLQNLRKRLDQRPASTGLTFGIQTPEGAHNRLVDIANLETSWAATLPLALAVRRRPLIQVLESGDDLADALDAMREGEAMMHQGLTLAALPAAERSPRPEVFTFDPAPRAQIKEAVRLGVGPTLRVGARLARRRLRPESPEKGPADRQSPDGMKPGIRYVGWVGKDNLGDEAMLEATASLLDWGDLDARGEATDLLLLGGGTLINRNRYLGWLVERDSPRIERAVLGTGVASPEFWGVTENTSEWLRWLGTCAYVGVRGPRSAETLVDWGFDGDMEICGDPALLLKTDVQPDRDGPIVVAPAWTGGELWGKSDETVYAHLADAITAWARSGREVVLMSCHPTDDRPILMIQEMLGSIDVGYHAGYLDVGASQRLIAGSSLVVGERLHACVLAAASGRPFVGIEYRPKVGDFADSVGMSHFALRSDQLSGDRLVELAAEAMTTSLDEMNRAVERYRSVLTRAGESIETAVRG